MKYKRVCLGPIIAYGRKSRNKGRDILSIVERAGVRVERLKVDVVCNRVRSKGYKNSIRYKIHDFMGPLLIKGVPRSRVYKNNRIRYPLLRVHVKNSAKAYERIRQKPIISRFYLLKMYHRIKNLYIHWSILATSSSYKISVLPPFSLCLPQLASQPASQSANQPALQHAGYIYISWARVASRPVCAAQRKLAYGFQLEGSLPGSLLGMWVLRSRERGC